MTAAQQAGHIHFRGVVLHGNNFFMQFEVGHASPLQTHAAPGFSAENHAHALAVLRLSDQPQPHHLASVHVGLGCWHGHQLEPHLGAIGALELGGGDSACEEATFLTRFASKVYLIHRRDELRASKIMADRALENEKIEPVWDSQVTEYLTDEDGEMRAVKVLNLKTDEEKELDLKCVFVAIGHVPNAQFLDGLVDTDENGYIIQVPGCTKTNVEGLFAAGDVADHVYRQAITAAGDGCKAALEAERYLAENE